MQNVRQRGKRGIFYICFNIPEAARSAFGGRAQVWRSLRTTDKSEARSKAAPILADLESRIAASTATSAAMTEPTDHREARIPISRPNAIEAIERWRKATIDADYHATVNGVGLPPRILTGGERYALQTGDFGAVREFRPLMVVALASRGIVADVNHPALDFLAQPFAAAILSVESWRERFGLRLIDGWPEADETPQAVPVARSPQAAPKAGMTISQLRDAWDAVKPLEGRQKGYIRRLIEFLGDRDIATVEPLDLDRFLLALRDFPRIRKPVDNVPFGQLIGAFPEAPRLHVKTVWNWTTVYKAMFAFAVSRRLLSHNPAEAMMKKPPSETASERLPFDEADLKALFGSPMYRGHDGRRIGYREKPGQVIVRDDRYWLPVVALMTGMRLEELASLRRSEVIREGDVVAFDLTGRPLSGPDRVKNQSARRMVPISKALIETGFVDWLDAGEGEFVFAGLEAAADGKRGTKFGKWFALWAQANASQPGEGIDDPMKPFHSLRHTFKRAARMSPVKEEIHDLITGHADGNGVARGYGRGVDLGTLKAAIDQIDILSLSLVRPSSGTD